MCIKDLVRNILWSAFVESVQITLKCILPPAGFSMIVIFSLSGSESQVFKTYQKILKLKLFQQRTPSYLVTSPQLTVMLIFGLGPLSCLVQLVEKYVCLFVQNSSTWKHFHSSSMNTETFNIQIQSFQLSKIRNSKLKPHSRKMNLSPRVSAFCSFVSVTPRLAWWGYRQL